jgi:hypothetical protein
MKLGVSYNLFDGEELLEGSIKQIRDHVDYISVVCQTTSNFGKPCSKDLLPSLKRLKGEKLIDEVLLYTPQIENGGHYNEIQKRNIGLQTSLKVGCTHHMSMDCDEYFITKEFNFLKKYIKNNKCDATYCLMKTYFKDPTFEVRPFNQYYTSLIHEINTSSQYSFNCHSPVLVDPTRRINIIKRPKIFERDEIEMYHMSYVRKNIKEKLVNSSSNSVFLQNLNIFLKMFENYKVGDTFFTTTPPGPPGNETTVLVENQFNIKI